MNRLKYQYGATSNHENSVSNLATGTPTNLASANLSATSIKYLKAAQNKNAAFGVSKGFNSTAHSNVLLHAQNLQNRSDSFGMHSSYSNQGIKKAEKYGSSLIQNLMSPPQSSHQQSSKAKKSLE